jgi:uncharacterized protein
MLELNVVEPIVTDSSSSVSEKFEQLQEVIRSLGSVVIGFSGGVDSTFLLKVARDVLGRENVRAVIGISETYPERELLEAMHLADAIDAEYETVRTEETDVLKFQENPPDRCYYCKNELYTKLEMIRERLGFGAILDGTNADDTKEFRPGMRALGERSVRSPLAEAGLTKNEIRILSHKAGLPTADKPSFACLSSRFPYGMSIDREKLKCIDAAENVLHDLGFRVVRVRFHDDRTARIELGANEVERAAKQEMRERISNELKALGFTYITLDLSGFRSGSMNEVLSEEQKRSYLS